MSLSETWCKDNAKIPKISLIPKIMLIFGIRLRILQFYSYFLISLCPMEEVFFLYLLRQQGEELVDQLVCHFDGVHQ